jgi:hypothetical protein
MVDIRQFESLMQFFIFNLAHRFSPIRVENYLICSYLELIIFSVFDEIFEEEEDHDKNDHWSFDKLEHCCYIFVKILF